MKSSCRTFSAELVESETGLELKPVCLDEVSEFLDEVGPNMVIGITTHDESIVVWYWMAEEIRYTTPPG